MLIQEVLPQLIGMLQNSNDSTYKRMWTAMSQSRPSVFVTNNEEGVDRVKKAKGLYAFFMESTSIEYQVERNCDLQQVGGLLDSKGYGIGLPVSEYTPRGLLHHLASGT
jgi:hypothetical protein